MVTVFNYYRVYDLIGADTHVPLNRFYTVATGSEVVDLLQSAQRQRALQERQVGSTRLVWVKLGKVSLTNKPKAKLPKVPTVSVTVCYDVSKVKVINHSGKSVVLSSRKNLAITRMRLSNSFYPDSTKWRVFWTDTRGQSCT